MRRISGLNFLTLLLLTGCIQKPVYVVTQIDTVNITLEEKFYFVVREDGVVRQYPSSQVRHIGPGLITVKEGALFGLILDEDEWTEDRAQAWEWARERK